MKYGIPVATKMSSVVDFGQLTQAAKRGYALLERTQPNGWQKFIDVDKLDIGCPITCMLAQLDVSYTHTRRGRVLAELDANHTPYSCMRERVCLSQEAAGDYGFYVARKPEYADGDVGVAYAHLTAVWKTLLQEHTRSIDVDTVTADSEEAILEPV
ncbi:MAG: hypothetical protein AAB472_01820 [Patescibacteria group bacterium]